MSIYTGLFIELSTLFGLAFLIYRTMYLRSKREALMKKYKSGAIRENVETMLSTRRIAITSSLSVLVIFKIGLDIHEVVTVYGSSAYGQLMNTLLLSLALFLIIIFAVYFIFKDIGMIIKL